MSSIRQLYKLSLRHIRLDKSALLRVHDMVHIASHDNDLGNQPRDFSQSVPCDPVRQSSRHLRNNANERLRPSGAISPQEALKRHLSIKQETFGGKRGAQTNLSLHLSIRPAAGVSFCLRVQPLRRKQRYDGGRHSHHWIFDCQQPNGLSDLLNTRIVDNISTLPGQGCL